MDVRWVRLVDIVGDGSCTDSFGRVIYDPYPTEGSAGFDLDAVGVINYRMDCAPAALSPEARPVRMLGVHQLPLSNCRPSDELAADGWATVAFRHRPQRAVTLEDPGPPAPGRFYRLRRTLLP